ncbi:MAG TPA: DUF554 domain-containing protein [Peptococcaceae bacterium]|nr:MAG: putative membrane protein, possible Na+ channel or pump [Clostridia bacterium 41_269]HBT19804.1 DUF554 domain-containing protein [Peptococcaceae bacterium]
MLGTIINVVSIILGTFIGRILGKGLSKNIKTTVLQGLGLGVLLVGFSMALETKKLIIVLISLLLGALIGEVLGIEDFLERFGKALEKKMSDFGKGSDIAKGFVSASLIYCVGAMAVMGALESGLTGKHSILFAKSLLDGVLSIVLGSTLGVGVAFSALSVFVYQGSITLLAHWLSRFLSQGVVAEMNAVGGLLIVGIALNILEVKKIKIGNLLPGIAGAFILGVVFQSLGLLN